jgi:hypothetical protein
MELYERDIASFGKYGNASEGDINLVFHGNIRPID